MLYLISRTQRFMKAEYVYVLQEREFIKTKENIFKVGKTKQENSKRFNQYPKDTILLLQTVCIDCDKTERSILSRFQSKYKQRKDIGVEYFEGDHNQMLRDINEIATGNVEDNSMKQFQRPPYIITDPEILDFITEAEKDNFNPIAFIKKAIRDRAAATVVAQVHVIKDVIPVTTSPTIPENCVIITKAELKKMYSEYMQLQNVHSQVIKSLQYKPRQFIKFCEAHTDVIDKCYTCSQNCGYTSATKIGMGLHLRKCIKNKTIIEDQSNNAVITKNSTDTDITEVSEENQEEFSEEQDEFDEEQDEFDEERRTT